MQGLVAAPQYNHAKAMVIEKMNADGRYCVQIREGVYKGTQLNCKPANLIPDRSI